MRDQLRKSLDFLIQVALPKAILKKTNGVGIKDIKCGLAHSPCLVCAVLLLWFVTTERERVVLGLHLL